MRLWVIEHWWALIAQWERLRLQIMRLESLIHERCDLRQLRDAARSASDATLADTKRRLAAMSQRAETETLGARKRSLGLAAAGTAGLFALFGLVSSNALAVNFAAANDSYKIYTNRVVGQYAAGYIDAQQKSSGQEAVAQIGFRQADLYGLCAIAKQKLPGPLGTVSLIVTGGEPVNGKNIGADPSKKISAHQLHLATSSLTGHGENIKKLTLGQSADTLKIDNSNAYRGKPGAFGLQAELLQIGGLDADSYGIDLQGEINLPDLKIRVLPGAVGKKACS